PGMVVCVTHAWTIFGLPFMVLAQARAGFTSPFVSAVVAIWLPEARGEMARPWASATRAGSFALLATYLIWLPAARGESNPVSALRLKVIAVRAAAPMVVRRIRVFIFLSFFWRCFIASSNDYARITPARRK